jgi:hypothetical protein
MDTFLDILRFIPKMGFLVSNVKVNHRFISQNLPNGAGFFACKVTQEGLEPSTRRLRVVCSAKLSYWAILARELYRKGLCCQHSLIVLQI